MGVVCSGRLMMRRDYPSSFVMWLVCGWKGSPSENPR
jgi:hypothetical protein